MIILRNPPTFYELIERHNLKLPTILTEVRRIVRYGSCRPSSYWGEYEFTEKDEKELRKYLLGKEMYTGEITHPFVVNFALRFLNMEEIEARTDE